MYSLFLFFLFLLCPFSFFFATYPVTYSRLLHSLVTPPCRFCPFHLLEVIHERATRVRYTTSSPGVNGRATGEVPCSSSGKYARINIHMCFQQRNMHVTYGDAKIELRVKGKYWRNRHNVSYRCSRLNGVKSRYPPTQKKIELSCLPDIKLKLSIHARRYIFANYVKFTFSMIHHSENRKWPTPWIAKC